jgi:hypothetical protein
MSKMIRTSSKPTKLANMIVNWKPLSDTEIQKRLDEAREMNSLVHNDILAHQNNLLQSLMNPHNPMYPAFLEMQKNEQGREFILKKFLTVLECNDKNLNNTLKQRQIDEDNDNFNRDASNRSNRSNRDRDIDKNRDKDRRSTSRRSDKKYDVDDRTDHYIFPLSSSSSSSSSGIGNTIGSNGISSKRETGNTHGISGSGGNGISSKRETGNTHGISSSCGNGFSGEIKTEHTHGISGSGGNGVSSNSIISNNLIEIVDGTDSDDEPEHTKEYPTKVFAALKHPINVNSQPINDNKPLASNTTKSPSILENFLNPK